MSSEGGALSPTMARLDGFRLAYLASPYRVYPSGLDAAYKEARALTSRLIDTKTTCAIFSPIVHCHKLEAATLPRHSARWLRMNDAYLDACDVLLIARMAGWEKSEGIKYEVALFARMRKPIFELCPSTLEVIARHGDAP